MYSDTPCSLAVQLGIGEGGKDVVETEGVRILFKQCQVHNGQGIVSSEPFPFHYRSAVCTSNQTPTETPTAAVMQ